MVEGTGAALLTPVRDLSLPRSGVRGSQDWVLLQAVWAVLHQRGDGQGDPLSQHCPLQELTGKSQPSLPSTLWGRARQPGFSASAAPQLLYFELDYCSSGHWLGLTLSHRSWMLQIQIALFLSPDGGPLS